MTAEGDGRIDLLARLIDQITGEPRPEERDATPIHVAECGCTRHAVRGYLIAECPTHAADELAPRRRQRDGR